MSITIAGNVTADPTPSRRKSGQPTRTTFTVIETHKWVDFRTGEPGEASELVRVSCRGVLAEHVLATIRRGDRIIVTGRLGRAEWITADGSEQERVTVLADDVALSLSSTTAIPDDLDADLDAAFAS